MSQRKSLPNKTGFPGGRPLFALLLFSGAAVVLAASSCQALGREPRRGFGIEDRALDEFVLHVDNHNFADARLYTRWNGDRRRIGTVRGNEQRNFTLDWDSRQLRIEVDFLAGGGFVSPSVLVNRGDTVVFRIPARAR